MSEIPKDSQEELLPDAPRVLSKTERIVLDLNIDSAKRHVVLKRQQLANADAYSAELEAKRRETYGQQ